MFPTGGASAAAAAAVALSGWVVVSREDEGVGGGPRGAARP